MRQQAVGRHYGREIPLGALLLEDELSKRSYMSRLDWYKVLIGFEREVLGTNPLDPDVLQTHIHNKQREIIMGQSKANKEVSKYIDALPISKERGDEEIDAIVAKIEELLGYPLDEEAKQFIAKGDLSQLKETVASVAPKGTTVFFWNRERNLPMIGNHMVLGFLKEAAVVASRTISGKKKNGVLPDSASFAHSIINTQVRVLEEFICFDRDIKRKEDGSAQYLVRSLRANGGATGPRVCLARSEVVPEGAKLAFHLGVVKNSPLTQEMIELYLGAGETIGFGQWRGSGSKGLFTYEIEALKAKPTAL